MCIRDRLHTALWAAGVIIVILREEELRESMMLPLIIIGSLIQVVAFICIVNYYWRLKKMCIRDREKTCFA